MSVLIELSGIARTYVLDGGIAVPVLRGIDLAVEQGEFVALMGPSGSGKTTLLQIIGCLDRADAGRYCLDGSDISQLADDQLSQLRGKTIGFIFQAFHLVPGMGIIDNVAMPLLYHGVSARERQRRSAAALERVGLGHRLDHLPSQLSGGEQQRCAIARSLVTNPRLLVADEPTGNLDSRIGAEIMTLFDELHREKLTIVLVTHDAGVGAKAQRIVRMRDGLLDHSPLQGAAS